MKPRLILTGVTEYAGQMFARATFASLLGKKIPLSIYTANIEIGRRRLPDVPITRSPDQPEAA